MKRLFTTIACTVVLGFIAAPARATSFTLEADHCTGTCGLPAGSPYGYVNVTQDGTDSVLVDVSLVSNVAFVSTGWAGSFAFNLTDPDPAIAVTFDTPSSGWSLLSSAAGSKKFDGFGYFEYVLKCDMCENGGSNPYAGELTFHVNAPNLTPDNFLELSTGSGSEYVYFVADILGPNGKTGPVGGDRCDGYCGSSSQQSPVPEPASLVLLGTGLGFIGRRFRRRASR